MLKMLVLTVKVLRAPETRAMELHKITANSHNSGQTCLKPFSWLDGAASHRPGVVTVRGLSST